MLKLQNIVKVYETGDTKVEALKGVDMAFRESEFVSILGPSGCGKTTLLNIIGGLDRYTSGDLQISGTSTALYKDSDWDTYRNHTIGFVFQSYNLIPHQSVLGNVELALTLSGVSKAERRERAKNALIKVGLEDQIYKMPNQLSGGQMQRVAIARALVNEPKIILADEPTGALDSETSVQVMNLLKEVANDHLVIMVTHNGELAEQYSTRIIRLLDGKMVSDSNPYIPRDLPVQTKQKYKKPSMSFWTALSLSLKNLFTKKARTILTSFAGSIGIIGIALILSLSDGFKNYISETEENTLSNYPLQITTETMNMESFMNNQFGEKEEHENDAIYANNMFVTMLEMLSKGQKTNDLKAFKTFLDNNEEIDKYVTDIIYSYNAPFKIYKNDYKETNKATQLIPFNIPMIYEQDIPIWQQLLNNQELLDSQYELITDNSRWPSKKEEVILIVNEDQELFDYILYALGLRDKNEIYQIIQNAQNPDFKLDTQDNFSYDEIIGLTFKMLTSVDFYEKDEANNCYNQISSYNPKLLSILDKGLDIEIVGIAKVRDDAQATSMSAGIGYTSELTDYIVNKNTSSPIYTAQKNNKTSVINTTIVASAENIINIKAGDELNDTTYNTLMYELGEADLSKPASISIYPISFEAKEKIIDIIDKYNTEVGEDSEDKKIYYTDFIGIMMSSISTIINAITYVLIAFVAISLVVSSIMIGIITYISVLERTKEIGVLRSIGASKKDISRVFNAETLLVGFVSGAMGIIIAGLLTIPINLIINLFAAIGNVAKLPIWGAIALVVISMGLTLIAGLIPSRVAAKKDPVIALRSE